MLAMLSLARRAWTPRLTVGVLLGLLIVGTLACAPVPASVPALAASAPVAGEGARQANDLLPGRILYVRDGNLWLWERGSARQFSEGGTWRQPAFSPDGKEIAYVYWWENFSDIFVMTADGSQTRRLTRSQASYLPDNSWAFRPTWSPDGERLAYVSDANSTMPHVWVMGRDGGNRRQVTGTTFGFDSWVDSLTWDPEGSRLAVTAAPSMRDPSHIYLVDVAKGTLEKLETSHASEFDPAWSPDGKSLAYIGRDGSGPGQLWVRSLDGEREAHVDRLTFVRSPVWSPDGKTLAVLAAQGGTFQVWVMSVRPTDGGYEIGEPRQVTNEGNVDSMSGLTWAP